MKQNNREGSLLKIAQSIVELFIPNLCVSCYQKNPLKEDIFCLSCKLKLPYTDQANITDNDLETRIFGRFKYERAAALFRFTKGSKVQDVVHQLKYKNRPQIGIALGRFLAKEILAAQNFPTPDIIIPIPLHYKKQIKRGYNQSQMFGQGLAEVLEVPLLENVLLKITPSNSQTSKGRIQRLENVYDSFQLKDEKLIRNKHILLIDDVITTGATIEAAAQKLLQSQNVRLSLGIIAMAEL